MLVLRGALLRSRPPSSSPPLSPNQSPPPLPPNLDPGIKKDEALKTNKTAKIPTFETKE